LIAAAIIALVDWHTLAQVVLAGRPELFEHDFAAAQPALQEALSNKTICVIGAGGSIGRATAEALLAQRPKRTLLVDLSENNLAEVTRRLRNRFTTHTPDFEAWALDYTREPFLALLERERPELVLNFAAFKHVRSEKDHLTLSEMIRVNVLGNLRLLQWAQQHQLQRFFVISTDKAANPASCMGATKRLMEKVLFAAQALNPLPAQTITTTRFANVLFSDGSLPASFVSRLEQRQPLAGPCDIRRYFITPREAARLCLLAACHPASGEFLVPRMRESDMLGFSEIATRFLALHGLRPKHYTEPVQALANLEEDARHSEWPCLFSPAMTSGEKPFEEFSETDEQRVSRQPYAEIDVLAGDTRTAWSELLRNGDEFAAWAADRDWLSSHGKADVVHWLKRLVPSFDHVDTHASLDRCV
jgi:FlaA1/EpsC-like NDP-sugar epimerase